MVDIPESLLAAEGPVDQNHDLLFSDHQELWPRLSFLANHISAAVLQRGPTASSIFGISAPWGAGKSSALRVVVDMIYSRLTEVIPGLDRDTTGFLLGDEYLVTTSTLRANLHAASRQPARLGLAYEVLRGFPSVYRAELLEDLGYVGKVSEAAPIHSEIFLRSKLGEFAETGPAIEEWILRSFMTYRDRVVPSKYSHVHIGLIDDLDRCPQAYTADVLAALNFWSSLPNTFFVIAADQEHLQRSAQAATELRERYVGEALEKFVHVQLRLPDLLSSHTQTARYLLQLIPKSESLPEGVQHLRRLLGEVRDENQFGLLAPSLRDRNPRQAKRVLNELVQEFGTLRDFKGDSVKRIVARLTWPADYETYIFPALAASGIKAGSSNSSPRTEWLQVLLRTARIALEDEQIEREAAAQRLCDLTDARGVDMQGCPPNLVLYLAATPTLQLPESPAAGDQRTAFGLNLGQASPVLPSDEDRTDTVSDLSTQIQAAYGSELWDEVRELAVKLVDLARTKSPEKRDAVNFGNAALRLERLDPALAWALHQLAHEADPKHTNIRLNLVDFVIDKVGQQGLDMIKEHLDWVAEHDADFRPERQRLLAARWAVKTGADISDPDKLVADSAVEPNSVMRQWERVTVLAESRLYEHAEQVARNCAEQETTETGGTRILGSVLRELADGLSGTAPPNSEYESRGLDMQRHMLCTGFTRDDDFLAGLAYNAAITLAARDYEHASAVLYRTAYEIEPQDAAVKGGYSRFLLNRMKDPRNAYAVQQGQEVTIPVPDEAGLREAFAELPPYFSSGDRWWEHYKPAKPYVREPFSPMTALCPGTI